MCASAARHDSIGIDFGTTNSTVARLDPDGQVHLASFSFQGEAIPSFRSVLYFEQAPRLLDGGMRRAHAWTGPEATSSTTSAPMKKAASSNPSNPIFPAGLLPAPKSSAAATVSRI